MLFPISLEQENFFLKQGTMVLFPSRLAVKAFYGRWFVKDLSFKGLFNFLLKNSFTISLADDEKRCQSGHQATSQVSASSTWIIFNESAFIFWILQGLSWIIFCQTVPTTLLLSRMRVMRANVGKGKVQLMGGNFRFCSPFLLPSD